MATEPETDNRLKLETDTKNIITSTPNTQPPFSAGIQELRN